MSTRVTLEEDGKSQSGSVVKAAKTSIEAKSAPEASKSAPEANATADNALVKVTMEDIFPDGCERYQKDCCCCHCVDMRCALKRIAFLQTPEGKKRLEMKMQLKNIFMDIRAMAHVRRQIEGQLHSTKDLDVGKHNGFPMSIVNVEPIDENCMLIEWSIDDNQHVSYYEIYVDCKPLKRVFDINQTKTVLLNVNMKRSHRVLMKAVAKAGLGTEANAVDRLIISLLCGGLEKAIRSDYFSQFGKESEVENKPKEGKQKKCQTLMDFWKASEFLYVPACKCQHQCDCYLYV